MRADPQPTDADEDDVELQLEVAGALLAPAHGDDAKRAAMARAALLAAARATIDRPRFEGDVAKAANAARLSPRHEAAVRALLRGEPTTDLAIVEAAVTELVRGSAETSRWTARLRHHRLAATAAAIALAALAVGIVVSTPAPRRPSDDYRFRASSAERFFRETGKLGDHGPYELVFHTQLQEQPWVVVDLGERRTISEVKLLQRADCCADRGVPLVIEVSDDGEHFVEVARHEKPFADWSAKFAPRSARYVRLQSTRRTYLHLRDVEIR